MTGAAGLARSGARRLRSAVLQRGFALLPALIVLVVSFRLVSAVPGHTGDSMQFQFLAQVHGVAHPPGAPVYVSLVWCWNHLFPWDSPARAANAFSVLSALIAVVFGVRLLRAWDVPSAGAGAAFLALVTTPLWLRLSDVAELYVPAVAVGLVALERTQAWADGGRNRQLLLVGLLLGLGAGIHPTVLFFGPSCLFLALRRELHPWRRPVAWWALSCLLLGLALAAATALFVATASSTRFVWTPIESAEEAWRFLSASSFRGHMAPLSWERIFGDRGAAYVGEVFGFATWLTPLGALGLLTHLRRWMGPATLSLFLLNAAYVLRYDVYDVWDFVLPAQVVFALWVGLGIGWLVEHTSTRPRLRAVSLLGIGFLVVAQALLLPDRVDDAAERLLGTGARDRAVRRLETAGPGAVIASPVWDDSCALWYQTFVHPDRFGSTAVAHAALVKDLRSYLLGEGGLFLDEERRVVPPGHEVFLLRDSERALAANLLVYTLPDELHLLRLRADPDVDRRWPGLEVVEHRPDAFRVLYVDGWASMENWGIWMLDARGGVVALNLPAHAVLEIGTSLWFHDQSPIDVGVEFDGEPAGHFVVDTPPWRERSYRVPLGNAQARERAILVLDVGTASVAPGDRPRGLPVMSIRLAGSGRQE